MGRLTRFYDWLVPELAKLDVWGVSIGNEMEGTIEDEVLTEAEVLNHLRIAMRHINSIDPNLAVSVTFTGTGIEKLPNLVNSLVAEMDIVTFNNYCISDSMKDTGPRIWKKTLKRWKNVAGDKDIFITELGCPVGFEQGEPGVYSEHNNKIGTDIELQNEFFAYHMDAFANDPQLRAATIFQLYDWSPELSVMFTDPFREAGIPLVGDRLEEWLATTGMCRWSDTQCRPAWDTWLNGLQDMRAERDRLTP